MYKKISIQTVSLIRFTSYQFSLIENFIDSTLVLHDLKILVSHNMKKNVCIKATIVSCNRVRQVRS